MSSKLKYIQIQTKQYIRAIFREECQLMLNSMNSLPNAIFFQTRLCSFEVNWANNICLKVQAINKNQPTKLFKGQMKADSKKTQDIIQRIFVALYELKVNSDKDRIDYLSSKIAVIDASLESNKGQDYRLRIMINDKQFKEIQMTVSTVEESYFIRKELSYTQRERLADRMVISELSEKFQIQSRHIGEQEKKIVKQTEDMKEAFKENISELVSVVTNRIHQQFKNNAKKYNLHDDQQQQRKRLKKMKKQIKKQKKLRKQKKQRKKEKKKRRKQQKEREKLLQGRENQINNGVEHHKSERKRSEISIRDDDSNAIDLDAKNDDELKINDRNRDSQDRRDRKHKKKKDKHKHKERRRSHSEDEGANHRPTQINGMSKLRQRGATATKIVRDSPQKIDLEVQSVHDIDEFYPKILERHRLKQERQKLQGHIKQGKPERPQRDAKDKKPKRQKKKKEPEEGVEEQGEAEYYRRIEELRRTGNIQATRIDRINRLRQVMRAPPVLEFDEFNPNYNGEPKYKPFVQLNEYQVIRPGQVFTGRLDEPPAATKKIPVVFRSEIPSHKSFDISANLIRKIGGQEYQQLVFDYPIPSSGKHILTMRVLESERSYIWFGVIDLREKDREQSYNKKSCIAFSLHTGHVVISNKWSKDRKGLIQVGLAVRMEIDMDRNCITWYVSDGRTAIASISKTMQKLTLAPYFEMMKNNDEVCFEE